MKFIIQVIFTIVLGFIMAQFFPFWSVALSAFIIAIGVQKKVFVSFLAGLFSIIILWGVSAWVMSSGNDHILLERVASVFSLSPELFLGVNALVGGLLGAFAAATGSQLRALFVPNRKRRNPYKA